MRIQSRLTLFTASLVTLLSCLLGGIVLQQNYSSKVEEIEKELNLVSSATDAAENDKVTTALSLVQEASTPISIFFVDPAGELTSLIEAPDVEVADSYEAIPHVGKEIGKWGRLRLAVADLEGDSRLLFIATTASALDQRKRDLITLAFSLVLVLILSLAILRLVIARDIKREQDNIEEKAIARLEAKHREELIEFVGDASHELRTPITVIKGFLEILQRQERTDEGLSPLQLMWREVLRMEVTLNQLLEILENQERTYSDSEQVDLSLILNDKLNIFRRLNQSRHVDFEIEEQVVIQGHLDVLNRVFDNLLINIHKHTAETVPVYVSLKRRSDQVEIEFHDGGSGLEKLENGFEIRPFKRFDKSRSRETGGSGLGLSIVESSVKLLGGKLLFRRSHLGGLAVRIELPISTSALC